MGKSLGILGVFLFCLPHGATAQFHSRTSGGQATATHATAGQTRSGASTTAPAGQPQATAAAAGTAPNLGPAQVGANTYSTIYMSEAQKKAFAKNNLHLGEMELRDIDVWGRIIHHSDETYTESTEDVQKRSLEQLTKSKNGVVLQKRLVMLDARNRPSEVMIYDGRNALKYRGELSYDQMGRFSEENLYDVNGKLIRKRLQPYGSKGEKLPLRSWDYATNIPDGLKLVITRESEQVESAAGSANQNQKQGRGIFAGGGRRGGNTNPAGANAAPSPVPTAQAPRADSSANATAGRRGAGLGRLFGGKREQ